MVVCEPCGTFSISVAISVRIVVNLCAHSTGDGDLYMSPLQLNNNSSCRVVVQ